MNAPDARMPAIDHAGGVARLMGDSALFARILARFRKEYRETAAGIRRALDEGDRVLALRLVHTLKGASGMIEARSLKNAAQALEQDLRRDAGDAYAHLALLEGALDQVLRELDAAAASLPPASAPAPAPAPVNVPAQRDTLRRLATLLDDGNGDAVDLVREAEATLRAELGDEAFERLAATIESYDFDAALAMLNERASQVAGRVTVR